ncbi:MULTISPECIES: MoaD/ThiS family protein [Liquorilactobacillus]|uniref:MoaD/ThiS family protein n=1 Tax=Liquorilactobacillus TaxID=2767888 RepID=UPI0039E79685
MMVTIKLFAMIRDQLGENIQVELPEVITEQVLKQIISQNYPQVETIIRNSRFAIDCQFMGTELHHLTESNEIAIIPPVSGG